MWWALWDLLRMRRMLRVLRMLGMLRMLRIGRPILLMLHFDSTRVEIASCVDVACLTSLKSRLIRGT